MATLSFDMGTLMDIDTLANLASNYSQRNSQKELADKKDSILQELKKIAPELSEQDLLDIHAEALAQKEDNPYHIDFLASVVPEMYDRKELADKKFILNELNGLPELSKRALLKIHAEASKEMNEVWLEIERRALLDNKNSIGPQVRCEKALTRSAVLGYLLLVIYLSVTFYRLGLTWEALANSSLAIVILSFFRAILSAIYASMSQLWIHTNTLMLESLLLTKKRMDAAQCRSTEQEISPSERREALKRKFSVQRYAAIKLGFSSPPSTLDAVQRLLTSR